MLINSVFFPLQKESLVLHLFLFLLCPRKTVRRHTGELGGAALFKLESHGPKGPEEMMVELRRGQRQAREIGHIQASLIEIFGKQLHCVIWSRSFQKLRYLHIYQDQQRNTWLQEHLLFWIPCDSTALQESIEELCVTGHMGDWSSCNLWDSYLFNPANPGQSSPVERAAQNTCLLTQMHVTEVVRKDMTVPQFWAAGSKITLQTREEVWFMVRAEGLFCFIFQHWRLIKFDFISLKTENKPRVRPMDKFKAKNLQDFKWKSWLSQDKAFFSLWSYNWL